MYKLLQEKKEKTNNKDGGKDETMAEKLYTGSVYTEKLHYKNNEGGGTRDNGHIHTVSK